MSIDDFGSFRERFRFRSVISKKIHVGAALKYDNRCMKNNVQDCSNIDLDSAKRGGGFLAIEYLEKPKGCLKTLKLLNEQEEITIRGVMRKTSLSQSGAYSSLDHLTKFGLIGSSTKQITRGTPRRFKLTKKGEELRLPLSIFFDSLKFVFRKRNIDSCLELPYRSLEILLRIHQQGHASLTNLVEKGGICKSTASSALKALVNLGLLRVEMRKDFRLTRKEYSLTEKGQYLGKIVLIVDETLNSLVILNQV